MYWNLSPWNNFIDIKQAPLYMYTYSVNSARVLLLFFCYEATDNVFNDLLPILNNATSVYLLFLVSRTTKEPTFQSRVSSSSSSSDRVDSRGTLRQPRVATTTRLGPFGTNAEGCTVADLLDPWMARASWPSPPKRGPVLAAATCDNVRWAGVC